MEKTKHPFTIWFSLDEWKLMTYWKKKLNCQSYAELIRIMLRELEERK